MTDEYATPDRILPYAPSTPGEPVRVTSWLVGLIIVVCQSAMLWAVDTEIRGIVIAAAADIIAAVTTGEIARRKVTPI